MKTMYFGGAVLPPTRINTMDKEPASSFDACFDFSVDQQAFDKIHPEENSDPKFCFKVFKRLFGACLMSVFLGITTWYLRKWGCCKVKCFTTIQ